MELRNRRGRARGFAPFVAFALLFAFALGQGSSLVAFAFDNSGAGPTVSKDGSAPAADDSGKDGGAADDGTAKVSGSGPAAIEARGSGDGGGGSSSGGTAAGGGSAAAPAAVQQDEPGPPSGSGEQPILLIGNQNCAEVIPADEFLFEYRAQPVEDDTVDLAAESGGVVEGTLTIDVHDENLVDFEITDGSHPVIAVVVKGGPNANLYDYRPAGTFADTDLHAPLNENGSFYGLSHISFCFGEAPPPPPVPDIDVEKTCPATVPAGEPIDYTITVENTGEEALVDVMIDDSILGDITGDFDFDFTGEFPVGEVATATVSYTPGANEDPVENTVTATGTGAESDSDTSDDDSCTTDVIQGPAIAVSKECPAVVDEGDTITYEITVSNTGTENLTGVTVEDSVIGDLSGSYGDTLAVGASETHSFDHTAGSPGLLTNEVTVSGSGSEETVTATADCTTEIVDILGGGPTQPPTVAPTAPGPGTAFTGSEAGTLGLIALLALGLGLLLVAATRRWRSEDTA